MDYTLSYYKPHATTVLVRRTWWAFWRHDTLEHKPTMARVVFCHVPEDEAQILMAGGNPSAARLARRLMGSDATMLQLEAGRPAPQYVPTTGRYVETAGHNLMPNSEPPNVVVTRAQKREPLPE